MTPLVALRALVKAVKEDEYFPMRGADDYFALRGVLAAAEETLARVDAVGPCEFPGSMMLREPCPECAHPVEQHRHPDKVCQACLLEGHRTEVDA